MVALFMLIWNVLKRWLGIRITVIRRLPAAKSLDVHLLGLAAAVTGVLMASAIAYQTTLLTQLWVTLFWIGLILLGVLFGSGITTLLAVITFLILTLAGGSSVLFILLRGYVLGYAFGAVFAILYNDLVYLYLRIFERRLTKIAFAVYDDREVNIIKSPIQEEERALRELAPPRAELLYDYEIAHPPAAPYTILFVANPFIRRRKAQQADPDVFAADPILDDRELFLNSVNRALRSFEDNEALGHPEIWSRVRVVVIFDDSLKTEAASDWALIEELQIPFVINDETIENILDPLPQMTARVSNLLQRYETRRGERLVRIEDVDIIFGMSAWPNYIRSFAHFSDYREGQGGIPDRAGTGAGFHFEPAPNNGGGRPVNANGLIHEFRVSEPGRVALSVVGANQRTFIHEFAHAMSSMINGAVADEYTDRILVIQEAKDLNTPRPLYINQIERPFHNSPRFNGVPKVFADYNGAVFHSDLAHPSAKEHWLGYFPDRPNPDVGCTMDRYFGHYRFDNLIGNFMYDRLTAKLNRP